MARVCDICGKSAQRGKKLKRLGKRALARRVKGRMTVHRQPNLQWQTVKGVRQHVCTSCIRSQTKSLATAAA